jgi:hypothetical protein
MAPPHTGDGQDLTSYFCYGRAEGSRRRQHHGRSAGATCFEVYQGNLEELTNKRAKQLVIKKLTSSTLQAIRDKQCW